MKYSNLDGALYKTIALVHLESHTGMPNVLTHYFMKKEMYFSIINAPGNRTGVLLIWNALDIHKKLMLVKYSGALINI